MNERLSCIPAHRHASACQGDALRFPDIFQSCNLGPAVFQGDDDNLIVHDICPRPFDHQAVRLQVVHLLLCRGKENIALIPLPDLCQESA